jgi:hypothetical protein
MNRTNWVLSIVIAAVLQQITYAESESLKIVQIINHSGSTFTIKDTNLSISAGQAVSTAIDLGKGDLVLIPGDKSNFHLMISQIDKSGVELLRSELISCVVQECRITQFDLETIKGLKLPTTYFAPGSTALPREIVCRRGDNILEIYDHDVKFSGLHGEYTVDIHQENMVITNNTTMMTKYAGQLPKRTVCRPTQTADLIPGFTQSGVICSGVYTSANFPNYASTCDRSYLVYLPHGYFDEPNTLYPLLYHLHGIPSTPEEAVDRVSILLDLMIADKRIVPMIVVFPNGNAPVHEFMGLPIDTLPDFYQASIVVNGNSIPAFWANSERLGNMENDVMNTLFQHIESTYQTMDGRQYRGVNGFSGGAGSQQMVLAASDRFGSVSSNSGYGVDWQTDITVTQLMDNFYAAIFTELGYENPHLRDLDPFDPVVYGIVTQLPWMYALATALAPNATAPYETYLPIDSSGAIDPVVQALYQAHSATSRAAEYADAILNNKLKIYADAASYDFFYGWQVALPTVYVLFDLLSLGAGYYNYSNNIYSQALNAQGIKHEFISFKGNHNGRSNLQTMSALLFHSAVFSQNEQADSERIKLIGTGTVVLDEDAIMVVDRGATIGIETLGAYTNLTDIDWQLKGRAKLQIGTEGRAGGAFQIGNTYDKFDLENDPTLRDHVINFKFFIDGPDAALQINQQGVLGMAAGVQGQGSTVPNFYVMKSLSNVKQIDVNVPQGIIQHSQIIPGDDARAALWAIGPCTKYNFTYDKYNAAIYGGGNLVEIQDADLLQPTLDEGMFEVVSGKNIDFATDHAVGTFAGPVSQGIRDIQETTSSLIYFANFTGAVSVNGIALTSISSIPPANLTINASHAHLNGLNAQVMSSELALRDDNKVLPSTDMTQDECFEFLKLDDYDEQYKKTAPIARNNTNEATLVYVDSTLQPEGDDVIVRVPGRDFPELTTGVENGVQLGSIGIALNNTDPRELVQVYDLEEQW